MTNAYDTGRLNLPFVGICTFGKRPPTSDWDAHRRRRGGARRALRHGHAVPRRRPLRPARDPRGLDAVLLRPWRRLRPRGRRRLSARWTRCASSTSATPTSSTPTPSRSHAQHRGRRCARSSSAGALPVVLGGDHSVNIPCIDAFERRGADPHRADRRASRLRRRAPRRARRPRQPDAPRGGASACHRADAARHPQRLLDRPRGLRGRAPAHGLGHPLGAPDAARSAPRACSSWIPAGARYYVTIDIDGFDPSIAPGTGTPSHGGFLYYEVLEILQALAQRGTRSSASTSSRWRRDYDHSGITAILAAQVLLNFLGFVFHARAERATAPEVVATAG